MLETIRSCFVTMSKAGSSNTFRPAIHQQLGPTPLPPSQRGGPVTRYGLLIPGRAEEREFPDHWELFIASSPLRE